MSELIKKEIECLRMLENLKREKKESFLRLKVTYVDESDKEKLIEGLQHNFNVTKVSRDYKKEGLCKRIYINLTNK